MSDIPFHRIALDDPEFSLRDLLAVVRRRWAMIVLPFCLTVGGAVGLSIATPPAYRATSTVTVDRSPPVILLDRAGEVSLFADQAPTQAPNVATLAELIKSDLVRDGAVLRLAPTLGDSGAQDAVSRLSVQTIRDTELVRISVEHTNPDVAAVATNAVVDSLVDMNLKGRRRRATEVRRFIDERLALAGQKLRASEVALVQYKDRHGDVSLAEETTLSLQRLAELEAQRVEARLPRLEAASLVNSLKSQLAALEIELSGLQKQFTANHPAVIATRAKIAETARRLEAETHRSRATEQSREQGLSSAIADYESRIRGIPTREAELARLTRDTKEAEQIYLLLSSKLQQAIIAEASIGSAVQVVDTAKVPTSPAQHRARRMVILGAVLGLLAGAGAALFSEQLDATVRSADEVEEVLGAPVLGAIPVAYRRDGVKVLRARGSPPLPLARMDRPSPFTEAYRTLRTHLLSVLPDRTRGCLLVTSALPAEGKSTTAANVALAFAHAGRRVWLVDGDLRHATLSRLLSDAASPGLAAVLVGRATALDVAKPTDYPNLSFVASGRATVEAPELLITDGLGRFLETARAKADIVIIDSPALVPTTDAEAMAGAVDGVLVVVKADKTDRPALAQMRQRLERVGARVIGAVLNRATDRPWRL
jgi:capsular exopolysaccharide synthesis family protein